MGVSRRSATVVCLAQVGFAGYVLHAWISWVPEAYHVSFLFRFEFPAKQQSKCIGESMFASRFPGPFLVPGKWAKIWGAM